MTNELFYFAVKPVTHVHGINEVWRYSIQPAFCTDTNWGGGIAASLSSTYPHRKPASSWPIKMVTLINITHPWPPKAFKLHHGRSWAHFIMYMAFANLVSYITLACLPVICCKHQHWVEGQSRGKVRTGHHLKISILYGALFCRSVEQRKKLMVALLTQEQNEMTCIWHLYG